MKKQIMVVYRDARKRGWICQRLKSLNEVEVVEMLDYEAAGRVAEEERPDLIIVDAGRRDDGWPGVRLLHKLNGRDRTGDFVSAILVEYRPPESPTITSERCPLGRPTMDTSVRDASFSMREFDLHEICVVARMLLTQTD